MLYLHYVWISYLRQCSNTMHYQEHCFQLTAVDSIRFYMHLAKLLLSVIWGAGHHWCHFYQNYSVSWFCPCKLGAFMSFFILILNEEVSVICCLYISWTNSMGFAILLNVSFLSVEFLQLLDKWNFLYEIHSILKSFFLLSGLALIPWQFMWHLCWKNFHWYKFSCEYVSFCLPLLHDQFFMFTFLSYTIDVIWSYYLAALLNKPL